MTESTVPFTSTEVPQGYLLTASLTYQWDVATLEWIKGTQPTAGAGGAVTITDGADVTQGAKADAAWVAGDGTVIALLKTIASGGGGLTDAELRATPVPVSGTVTANTGLSQPLTDAQLRAVDVPISVAALPLPSGAATSALQTQPGVDIGDVTVNNAAGASAVNIQDGGNTITVDGTVAVSGSVAVTGPLTDAELRAVAVPVSGTVSVTETAYITRLDEASATITYVGEAVTTTLTSAASWRIKRLDSTSGLVVLYAAGTTAFNQIWDNRAALAYS